MANDDNDDLRSGIDAALGSGDVESGRRLMRKALRDDTITKQELAAQVVEYADRRILAGDVMNADRAIIGAVHEGVAPHIIFNAIKTHARKKGAVSGSFNA